MFFCQLIKKNESGINWYYYQKMRFSCKSESMTIKAGYSITHRDICNKKLYIGMYDKRICLVVNNHWFFVGNYVEEDDEYVLKYSELIVDCADGHSIHISLIEALQVKPSSIWEKTEVGCYHVEYPEDTTYDEDSYISSIPYPVKAAVVAIFTYSVFSIILNAVSRM